MREERPLSFFSTSSSQLSSFLRWTMRWALKPQTSTDADEKRSWASGIAISSVQPPSSTDTSDRQTASQVSSK